MIDAFLCYCIIEHWFAGYCADTCPFQKLHPDVLVMQASQDRIGDNSAGPLDGSMQQRIFL
jgi:hypothetical protein